MVSMPWHGILNNSTTLQNLHSILYIFQRTLLYSLSCILLINTVLNCGEFISFHITQRGGNNTGHYPGVMLCKKLSTFRLCLTYYNILYNIHRLYIKHYTIHTLQNPSIPWFPSFFAKSLQPCTELLNIMFLEITHINGDIY